ncbi:MAG: PilZ domain-containing protein [Deltaproteobacteria bacterium]|nr:MAG: PilZ domain-containing protein [Deltaproteobacteria bacterium]
MLGDVLLARAAPRIPVEVLCTELDGDRPRHALVVDLSPTGVRLRRPVGGRTPRTLALEFEVPGVDEIVWARGRVAFDRLGRLPRRPDGRLGDVIRTTGVELIALAERHRRLLRDVVMDAHALASDWTARAACYLRG